MSPWVWFVGVLVIAMALCYFLPWWLRERKDRRG